MKPNWAILCSILVIIFAGIGYSQLVPATTGAALAERADLIVLGQVLSVTQKGIRTIEVNGLKVPSRIMVGEILVDRSLKGSIDSSKLLCEFDWPDVQIGYGSVDPKTYRMVFLKKTHSGYSLASPYYPSLVAVPGVPLRQASALENVSTQLAAVLQNPQANDDQKQEALTSLQTLRIPSATDALKRVLQEPSTSLRLMAAAVLLEQNDISGLAIGEAALTRRPKEVPNYLLLGIASAISQGVRDQRAIPALSRLLRAPEVETRRAAASALWHTGSPTAASALVTALNDQDFEVRFYGVIGLAEITGQKEWHPNMQMFHEEESKYLHHWREWSLANYPAPN